MAIMISLALVMTSLRGRPAGSDNHFTRETTFTTTASNLQFQQVKCGGQVLGRVRRTIAAHVPMEDTSEAIRNLIIFSDYTTTLLEDTINNNIKR